MIPWSSLALFSAQTVSMTPAAGSDFSTASPTLGQKSSRIGHAFSGGMLTTSQRWSPWRSSRANAPVGATVPPAAVAALPAGAPGRPAAAVPEAVNDCGRSGTVNRSSRGSWERSGGTSSGVERVFAFW